MRVFQDLAVVLHSISQMACIEIESGERIETWSKGHRQNSETTRVEPIARIAAGISCKLEPVQQPGAAGCTELQKDGE